MILQKDVATPPTFAQWAAAARVDQKTLRKRLNYGSFCKGKMIKSNIRLVISIAKNYQGAGMNLQDYRKDAEALLEAPRSLMLQRVSSSPPMLTGGLNKLFGNHFLINLSTWWRHLTK